MATESILDILSTAAFTTVSTLTEDDVRSDPFANKTRLPPAMDRGGTLEELRCVRRHFDNQNKTFLIYRGFNGIPHNLVLNVVVWLVLFLIFFVFRRLLIPKQRSAVNIETKTDLKKGRSARLESFFGWIPRLYTLRKDQLGETCGVDAVLYLLLQQYLMVYLLLICGISVIIVLPVNYYGGLLSDEQPFGKTTIGNIDGDSSILWLHTVLAVVYGIGLAIVVRMYVRRHLKRESPTLVTRTILITNIAPTPEAEAEIINYIREQFPDVTLHTWTNVCNLSTLLRINVKRQEFRDLAERSEALAERTGHRGQMYPSVCGPCCWCCCKKYATCRKVDASLYYQTEESKMKDAYRRLRPTIEKAHLPLAFLTFSNTNNTERVYRYFTNLLRWQYLVACCRKKHSYVWRCGFHLAPAPQGINWGNLSQPWWEWWIKVAIVNACLIVLLLLFTTPSVLMNLIEEWHLTETLQEFDSPFLVSILPVLILLGFAILLPSVVYYLEVFVGHWFKLTEQRMVMIKTFIFLLFMVLILPSLGLTSANALFRWLTEAAEEKDGAKFRWSCIFLPDNGAYFVNYVISSAFIGTIIQLLRIPSLLWFLYKFALTRSSAERSLLRRRPFEEFSFGVEYAWSLLIFNITVTYSLSVPIIVPFGLLYMFFKYCVDKHNFYYIYKPTEVNSGPHRRAVMFSLTATLLLMCNVVTFTALRADQGVPPNAIILTCILVITLGIIIFGRLYEWITKRVRSPITVQSIMDHTLKDDKYAYIPEVLKIGELPEGLVKMLNIYDQRV